MLVEGRGGRLDTETGANPLSSAGREMPESDCCGDGVKVDVEAGCSKILGSIAKSSTPVEVFVVSLAPLLVNMSSKSAKLIGLAAD